MGLPRLRPGRRTLTVGAAALAVTVAAGVPALATIDPTVTALDLAQAIGGPVTSASFDALPSGTPHAVSDTPLGGFPTDGSSYAILTTGNADFADDPNTSAGTGAALGGGAVRGDTDRDVSVLKIDLDVPAGVNCLSGLQFKFYSEEFPEFVGSSYNDAFIAELDSSTWTTSGTTINAPKNFAFDQNGDVISINTSGATAMSAAEAAGTTYDGATPLLTAATPITPGLHALYLSIFDQGDNILDSAVFVDKLELIQVTNPVTDCKPGAKPVDPTPPLDCASINPSLGSLWPPDNKLRDVTLAAAGNPTASVVVTGVTQDEVVKRNNGDPAPDAVLGENSPTVKLRAQREGGGDGRVYRVAFTASSPTTTPCSGIVIVGVPHDQRGTAAVDSGNSFDSAQS